MGVASAVGGRGVGPGLWGGAGVGGRRAVPALRGGGWGVGRGEGVGRGGASAAPPRSGERLRERDRSDMLGGRERERERGLLLLLQLVVVPFLSWWGQVVGGPGGERRSRSDAASRELLVVLYY